VTRTARKLAAAAIVTLTVLTGLVGPPAGAATTFSDAFDRPDAPLGAPWLTANSTWGVRSGAARMLTARWPNTAAIATVDTATTQHTISADITLSPTLRRANAGLIVAGIDYKNNFFCKVEVTPGNPNGLMAIGRRLNGKISSLLVGVTDAGFTNGSTYHVTCARSGDVVTMTVGSRTISYPMTQTDLAAFGSATRVGLRTHLAPDEDDALSTYDNVVVDDPSTSPSPTPTPVPSPTASPAGTSETITVAAAGDICGATTSALAACAATADLIRSHGADLVLALGDNVYDAGTYSQYTTNYDPRWGPLGPLTRAVPGNHEYNDPAAGPGAEGYRAYFPDAIAPASTPLYYAFDAGAWHFVALDTDIVQSGEGQPGITGGSAQAAWFASNLAADPHACTLAFGHHPRWSSPDGPTTNRHGSQSHMSAVWQTGVADGVDVWLAGHDHDYERFGQLDGAGVPSPTGTREFVVGTGGAAIDGFDSILSTSEFHASTHGVLFLSLEPTSYSWQFEDTSGAVLDSGGPVAC
jgi:hypothetical protein